MDATNRVAETEAARVQLELLKRAGTAARAGLAISWSETAIELARAGIRRAHPSASPEELDLLFVSIHYGDELARKVREYLARPHA